MMQQKTRLFVMIAALAMILLVPFMHHREAKAATIIAQAGDNPLVFDQNATTDNITYLVAQAAEHPDTVTIAGPGGAKGKAILDFDDTADYLAWHVSLAQGANYHVDMLVDPSGTETFELSVGANSLTFTSPAGIRKLDAGTIYIPAGESTITLTKTANNGVTSTIKALELVESSEYAAYLQRIENFKTDTTAFSQSKYGIMFQYGAWGYPQTGNAKSLDDQAADFDVPSFVNMIKGTGADYVLWSATWWTYEIDAPITAVDNIVSSNRTASRDLIGDVAAALDAEGIDFYMYYHTGQDSHLGYGSTDWWQAQNYPGSFASRGVGDRTTFFNNWFSVITEIGNRYGTLLDGWFFDDGTVYYPAPFEAMGAAARAGNPNRTVAYNNHGGQALPRVTDFADVAMGENCHGEVEEGSAPVGGDGIFTGGESDGLLQHCMFKTENGWGINAPNYVINSPNFSANTAIAWVQSASSRNVPLSFNILMYEDGTTSQETMDLFDELKNADLSTGDYINNDDPGITYTGSWFTSSNRGNGDFLDDLAATNVTGDSFEYTFTGTGIEYLAPLRTGYADMEIFIDGVSQGIYTTNNGGAYEPQEVIFSISGLPDGQHTLEAVSTSGGWFQLDALSVEDSPPAGTNIALNQPTSQSSTGYGGVPERAVDGNTSGAWNDGSVTHTNTEAQPWWEVDLGSSQDIANIVLFNRTNSCCTDRLTDFYVYISDSSFGSRTDVAQMANEAAWSTYHSGTLSGSSLDIAANSNGRYVRVQLSGSTNPLSLAEVQVISGSGSTPPTTTTLNNTEVSATYTGTWITSSNRGAGDYDDDVGASNSSNAAFAYTFTGTGVAYISPMYNGYASMEIFIDGVSQGTYTTNNGGAYSPQEVIFSVSGLSPGQHTIEVVKTSGGWLHLDALTITN